MIPQDPPATALAIDPAERRATPAPEGRGLKRPILVAGAGLCLLAAGAAGGVAITLMRKPPPAPEIRLGRVEDWPEIKDGVPALKTVAAPSPPAGTAVSAAPAPVASPAAPIPFAAPDLPTSVSLPRPAPPALATARESAVPAREAMPPLEPSQPSLGRDAVAEGGRAALAAREREPIAAEDAVVTVPLPPRRPIDAVEPARPKRVATAPTRPLAGPAEAAPMPLAPPMPIAPPPQQREDAAESDQIDVFGVKVPTIAATGRKIKNTFGAVGEAIRTLPDRF